MRIVMQCDVPRDYLSWPFHERVCLLAGTRRRGAVYVSAFLPVRNASKFPRRRFAVALSDYERIVATLSEDVEVLGVVHSHLPWSVCDPSDDDLCGLPDLWLGAIFHRGVLHWYAKGEAQPPWLVTGPRPRTTSA